MTGRTLKGNAAEEVQSAADNHLGLRIATKIAE